MHSFFQLKIVLVFFLSPGNSRSLKICTYVDCSSVTKTGKPIKMGPKSQHIVFRHRFIMRNYVAIFFYFGPGISIPKYVTNDDINYDHTHLNIISEIPSS